MSACEEHRNCSLSSEEKGTEVTAPTNEAFQNDEDVPNIFRIPPEIRAKILEKLDSMNLSVIRMTHPLLKSLVDHYLGINAVITDLPFELMNGDEFKERFKFYSNVALRNLRIGDVCEKKLRLGVNTKGLKKSSRFHSLILYPQYLQTIQFEGAVSAQFARKVLLYCINLRNFFIMVGANFTGGPIFPKLKGKNESVEEFNLHKRFHLTKLRTLKLMVVSTRVCANEENHTENIVSVLRSTRSAFLTRLILQIWVTRQMKFSSISWTIAKFLKLHPTLLSVFLGFMYENSQRFDSEEKLGSEELTRLLSLEKELHEISKNLTLQKVGFSSATIHLKFWVPLISQQSSLDHISLTYDKTTGSNWENICQNSSKSLLQFFIRGEFTTPFDCFLLETCTKLEEFCLHNTNDLALPEILVKNLTYLPISLTTLILFNTVTPTADIIHLLQKLNKLKTLVLFKTGRGNGNGVDINCLHHVFQMRSLVSVLIVRFIARDRHDAKQILEMMEIQENTGIPSGINVVDDLAQESDWEDGWDSDTDSSSSPGDSSSSSEEENIRLRSMFGRTNSSNSIHDGLIIMEEQHTIMSIENDNGSLDTNNSSNDLSEWGSLGTPGGSSIHVGNVSTTSTHNRRRGRSYVPESNGERYEFRSCHSDRRTRYSESMRCRMDFEDYFTDEEDDEDEEEDDVDEGEGIQEELMVDPNLQNIFNMGGLENIAEMNLNPEGNELQVVFDGDINLEEIDLDGLIQFPDVQVQFVLDTILDIISPELENSHWTRKEDMYGNVIFNLKLCLQTDF